jgi:hypothetical protein
MRRFRPLVVVILCLGLAAPAASAPASKRTSSIRVTKAGGLGRLEIHGNLGAVLQRDEGIVTLFSLKDPDHPKVLGRYDDDARQSLDGDLAFSDDGKWLFYARQTVQFSLDGVHIIDVSDPAAPTLAGYAPGGGAFRIADYNDGTDEWVVLLDAVTGLVVYRFVSETGQLLPVYSDPLPPTDKVGGPASAGLFIDAKDPELGKPLLYVATGGSGLQVYDFSDPTSPGLLGSINDEGLAEVEVITSDEQRFVLAATEYWFDKTNVPAIVVYDATKLDAIEAYGRIGIPAQAKDETRIQGMALVGGGLYAAYSSLGLVRFDATGDATTVFAGSGRLNDGAGVLTAPYIFDVEAARGRLYVTDAATGALNIIRL